MGFGHQTINIIEENNYNKQGGRKLKTVDYCLQYGNQFCNVAIIS